MPISQATSPVRVGQSYWVADPASQADGSRLSTTVRLDAVAAVQVGAAVAGRLTPAEDSADGRAVHRVADGRGAEFRVVDGRHGSCRSVRLRHGD
ncbi:hypothetical protein [Streptomyces sp. NPDC051561]|uniref:hypothetical protein n=1 Tax=Streptomyces sp. NPDC051561 TaxID=3365658 RepID=UPI00378FC7A8